MPVIFKPVSLPPEANADVIYFCPFSIGGLCDYAHYQAEALGNLGRQVVMLCQPDYPHEATSYRQDRCLPGGGPRPASKAARIAKLGRDCLASYCVLEKKCREYRAGKVVLASYTEYLGPLWAWRMRRLARRGIAIGAVVHDPVRDFVLGPLWWHRWSVSSGYSFLKTAFVHEAIELDTGMFPRQVETVVVPHGPYRFPDARETRAQTRDRLRIPLNSPLFLSFGHIRDGKNLGLVLRALQEVPEAYLLVAGTEARTGNVQSAEYKVLAEDLGVAERCRWVIGYAAPHDVAAFFRAADFALLTYEARFRSASGVLNVAVGHRLPVVASCGPSNLAAVVEGYGLGAKVAPESVDEIVRGMGMVLAGQIRPDWCGYEQGNSWEVNAKRVWQALETQWERR